MSLSLGSLLENTDATMLVVLCDDRSMMEWEIGMVH